MQYMIKKEMPKNYISRYEKINKKRAKSGLEQVTKEEYMSKLRQEPRQTGH